MTFGFFYRLSVRDLVRDVVMRPAVKVAESSREGESLRGLR